MKKVAIIGATGYTGQELIRLLSLHQEVEIFSTVSHSHNGKSFSSVYPGFKRIADFTCDESDIETLAEEADLIFLAMPHGVAAKIVSADVLKKCTVIDLGADFRLKNAESYKEWYGFDHPHPELLAEAAYGLSEFNRAGIATSKLIANPGCYATCSILTVAPLLKAGLISPESVVIDGKSGVSGAGRSPALNVHYNECSESTKAYKVAEHRHTPEIEEALGHFAGSSSPISFTPHLVPMNRGILITAYATLTKDVSAADLYEIYQSTYAKDDFIRIFEPSNCPDRYAYPETRFVKGSNYCDIGLAVDQRTKRVIAMGAIDNLIKGAAGQALQNMNIHFNFAETAGLNQAPLFPS